MANLGGADPGQVPLARAMSKLGLASRREAIGLILAGRVAVDGRTSTDPGLPIVPERARIAIDGVPASRTAARSVTLTLALHKPRGVMTTMHDPGGRTTVFDLLGALTARVVAAGRLDYASSGLLVLTSSTRLAAWLTDPDNAIPRVYVVTVRGAVDDATAAALCAGIEDCGARGETLAAHDITVRKRSKRETHLVVTLVEGRNREIRRLFAAAGHEVTRLKRVAFGGIQLGTLAPGAWREIGVDELRAAFPGCPGAGASSSTRPATRLRSGRDRYR